MTNAPELREYVAESIAWSRLLVLQSTRLLLHHALRRVRTSGSEADRELAEHLRLQTENAESRYRASRNAFERPEATDQRLEVCRRMIDTGDASVARLNNAARSLGAAQRFEMATDVQMLEELIEQWRESVNR